MKIVTALSAGTFGSLGTFTVWDDYGNKEDVPLPSTINTLEFGPDFPSWRRGNFSRTFLLGGHTGNLVFTEHKWLLKIGINAPSAPFVTPGPPIENQVGVVASGAAGLTGSCSFAFRFLDSLHFRRSPLGAASPAVALANQGATFTNVPIGPVPVDLCTDKIEIYVSVDGGLYRHWATRDVGASTFTVNETTTGEAYTEDLIPYPNLGFGDISTDRLFSAGDPRHPERVYISEVGQPEEYAGLYIPTRNGEPVIGIKNIGGSTIYVQCPNSSYYIQGFGVNDITMKILKPKIGGFGQRTIISVDDIALIPTQRGMYRCDGTSMVPIGVGDWDSTWRKSVSGDRKKSYSNGFGVADYVSGVIRFLAPRPNDTFTEVPDMIGFPLGFANNYWVINFGGLVPELGGSGQADLSFDCVNGPIHTCAAMLYDPNSEIGALYTGNQSGDIIIENQFGYADRGDADIPVTKRFLFHTAHPPAGPNADDDDGFEFTDAWVNYQCENLPATIGAWVGNEFAWQTGRSGSNAFEAGEMFTVPIGRAFPADVSVLNAYVPRDRYVRPSLVKSSGSNISMRLVVDQDSDNPGAGFNTITQR